MKHVSAPHIITVTVDDLKHMYFTSDSHFNHEKVIEYNHRPFNSIEEMNKVLIDNINNTVSSDDILVHCGDFMLGKCAMYDDYVNSINAKTIYGCIGNHDIKNIFRKGVLLPYIPDQHIYWGYNILFMVVNEKKKPVFSFTCSHCPYSRDSFLGIFNIHGHLHTFADMDAYDGRDKELALDLLEQGIYYDCGVDRNNYKPISFIDIVNNRPKIKEKILLQYPNFFDKF